MGANRVVCVGAWQFLKVGMEGVSVRNLGMG